jgi:hypothetical protein
LLSGFELRGKGRCPGASRMVRAWVACWIPHVAVVGLLHDARTLVIPMASCSCMWERDELSSFDALCEESCRNVVNIWFQFNLAVPSMLLVLARMYKTPRVATSLCVTMPRQRLCASFFTSLFISESQTLPYKPCTCRPYSCTPLAGSASWCRACTHRAAPFRPCRRNTAVGRSHVSSCTQLGRVRCHMLTFGLDAASAAGGGATWVSGVGFDDHDAAVELVSGTARGQ